MTAHKKSSRNTTSLPRRRFVQGVGTCGIAAGMGLQMPALWASENRSLSALQPQILSGNRFDLAIGETPVNFTGRKAVATTINGTLPAPTLRWREGERVTLRITNRLRELSALHW